MIQPTQEELFGLTILNQKAQQLQIETKRVRQAQMAYIGLLEIKYNAVFDEKTGQLNPKKEEPKKKD